MKRIEITWLRKRNSGDLFWTQTRAFRCRKCGKYVEQL